jgi:uncharacterized glyoxalase superfamily protein PhnB
VRRSPGWRAAYGFAERVRIGEDYRAQLRVDDGGLIVADVWKQQRPPRPGEITSYVMVRVEAVRSHCERARTHGAQIILEPTDFEYGERQYEAMDPFGHRWTFSETLADVAPEDWGGETVTEA